VVLRGCIHHTNRSSAWKDVHEDRDYREGLSLLEDDDDYSEDGGVVEVGRHSDHDVSL